MYESAVNLFYLFQNNTKNLDYQGYFEKKKVSYNQIYTVPYSSPIMTEFIDFFLYSIAVVFILYQSSR